MLIHCCGRSPAASRGRAGTPPVPGLEEFRKGFSKLAGECVGGDDGFPDQLKLWLRIHSDEDLRVHMLTRWLISHHVRGVAWRSPQGSWLDWRVGLFVRQFNRQMQCTGMRCTMREIILESHFADDI